MAEAGGDGDGVKILVVDDHSENLTALKAVLAGEPYELHFASSGEDALRAVLRHDFALILMDVHMRGMDGYETAAAIKAREKSRDIPIIFLTAMTRDIDQIFKAYQIGGVDYVQKPIEPHIVRAKVAVFAELYRKNQQLRRQERIIHEHEVARVRQLGQQKFEDLVEGIDHGFVWSADPELGRFTYVSPRARLILGYPVEQWYEEEGFWTRHVHPLDRDATLEAFRTARNGREVGIEHRFITAEGETVWLHTGARLARKGEGVGLELRGLSVDVTHLKGIEEALKEAVSARDEFLSIASHELKTPITPIKIQVQNLIRILNDEKRPVPKERVIRTLEALDRQVNRLTGLVEDLLDVSRISAGRLVLDIEPFRAAELVGEVVEHFRPAAEKVGSELRLSAAADPEVRWDRGRAGQVLNNLVSNALKFGEGKPVEITLEEKGDRVVISVRDSGVGIPLDQQQQIFGRFERARTSTGFGGMGLGLYIARKIVEAHGGEVRVQSYPGKGAVFIVELPRDAQPQSLIERVAEEKTGTG